MTTLRMLGAVALSSFFATAALADNPRVEASPVSTGGQVMCQVADADAATGATVPGFCVLPSVNAHTIAGSHLK
jgi:hypothetical protein